MNAAGVASALVVLGLSSGAGAFQIESVATTNCHERITMDAVEAAGWPNGQQPPPMSHDDEVLIDDVPFFMRQAVRNRWGVAVLIGVRNNDITDSDPTDLPELASLHNDPELQPEHCLRRRPHDYQPGNQQALIDCRAFILAEVQKAIGDGDAVDLDATTRVGIHLKFRGRVDVDVQRYGFHMGRALHALQDSYTHSFRNPDDGRVRTVLNWIEGNIGESYVESRDGHEHEDVLDDCALGTAGATRREQRATEASRDLLAAVADGQGGRTGRLMRATAVLDQHLAIESDCTLDNGYCDASELSETRGCSAAPGPGGWLGSLVLLALFATRRHAARLVVAATIIVTSGLAYGQDEAADDDGEEQAVLDQQEEVIESMPDPTTRTFGMALSGGFAIDRGAIAGAVGLRFNPHPRIGLGVDLELNPWVSYSVLDAAPGVVNLYVPAAIRLKKFGSWELRTTVSAGLSRLNFDLVGADQGSIGPYLGWNPLGVAIPLRANFKLVVKPADIAVPIPQVTGIPFYYHQYRATLSVEWYPN